MNAIELKSTLKMHTHKKPPKPRINGPNSMEVWAVIVNALAWTGGLLDRLSSTYFSAQYMRNIETKEEAVIPGIIGA